MTSFGAALINMLGTILTTIIAVFATYFMTRLNATIKAAATAAEDAARIAEEDRKVAQEEREAVRQAAKHVAARVDAVRQTLESTVTLGTQKLDEIHRLVDGKMTAQYKISEQALLRIAEMTGHPADIDAASRATQKVTEQEAIVAGSMIPMKAIDSDA